MTKEEIIERFKNNFQQYLIYVEEEIYCVDGDYHYDGIYACDDDGNTYKTPFELYETFIEYYDDDFEDEEARKHFEGFTELDESKAWDVIQDYFEVHYDYVSFGYYRKEHVLKNICFTKETAIELCKQYKNDAYYTTDRIKNNDIYYLKEFFNKLLET